jgi:hypothetical protein
MVPGGRKFRAQHGIDFRLLRCVLVEIVLEHQSRFKIANFDHVGLGIQQVDDRMQVFGAGTGGQHLFHLFRIRLGRNCLLQSGTEREKRKHRGKREMKDRGREGEKKRKRKKKQKKKKKKKKKKRRRRRRRRRNKKKK